MGGRLLSLLLYCEGVERVWVGDCEGVLWVLLLYCEGVERVWVGDCCRYCCIVRV